MTYEEIEQHLLSNPDRERIARFMGHTPITKTLELGRSEPGSVMTMHDWWDIDGREYQTSNLRYDFDFNWAMKVVHKIEKMDYGFKMCRKVVEIYIDSTKEVIIRTKESCRIDSLFKAIVEFVKWYEKQ
jgi:hypothetical protein